VGDRSSPPARAAGAIASFLVCCAFYRVRRHLTSWDGRLDALHRDLVGRHRGSIDPSRGDSLASLPLSPSSFDEPGSLLESARSWWATRVAHGLVVQNLVSTWAACGSDPHSWEPRPRDPLPASSR